MKSSMNRTKPLPLLISVVAAAVTASLAGCGGAPSTGSTTPPPASAASPTAITQAAAPSSGSGTPRPVACATVTSQGGLSPSSTSQVSLDQIGKAVGFTVTSAMPDTQSAAGGFAGYENCRYQFDTPAGGAQEDITLVVGTNPLDGKDAAAEFAALQSSRRPISERSCTGNGCDYTIGALTGVGDSALSARQTDGTEVIAVRSGRVYLEVGPGELKEERMVNLAKLIIGAVR